MSKFDINYSKLESTIDNKTYRFADVKDRIEKVAFDIVRFKDSDKAAELWQVQSGEDGDYIIALYQPAEEELEKTASSNPWGVVINKVAQDIQISYKGDPLVSIPSSKMGIPSEELSKVPSYLGNRLASNKKLVQALLQELDKTTKDQVLSKYPELI